MRHCYDAEQSECSKDEALYLFTRNGVKKFLCRKHALEQISYSIYEMESAEHMIIEYIKNKENHKDIVEDLRKQLNLEDFHDCWICKENGKKVLGYRNASTKAEEENWEISENDKWLCHVHANLKEGNNEKLM